MAKTEDSDTLRDGLLPWVGQPMGTDPRMRAPDEVNTPMIRHWVDALSDGNPIYLDEAAARSNGHPGIVAPPAMLQTWGMQRPVIEGIAERGGTARPVEGENVLTKLADAGHTGTLATNSELEFDRYLRPGDWLEAAGILESISERKTTGLGSGYFITWLTEYIDQTGESVGRQRFRLFKFVPGAASGKGSGAKGNAGKGDEAKTQASSGAGVTETLTSGEILPSFDLDVTSTVIVAGAIASRDFMPVHHDAEFARAQGAPDLFMNILTTNGYVARYVTDWAGPAARLRRIDIRLGAPCVPDKTLRFSGRVVSDDRKGEERHLTVGLSAVNDFGPHATGQVDLVVPA